MILAQSILFICLLSIPSSIVFSQTTSLYTAYQKSFPFNTSCSTTQYFDTALMQCSACPANAQQKATDFTQCDCSNAYYYGVNQGGGSLICLPCNATYVRSIDGFGCTLPLNSTCDSIGSFNVLSEADIQGNLYGTVSSSTSSQPRIGSDNCITCQNGTWPDPNGQRCTPCASVTPRTSAPTATASITCCTANATNDGICLLNIPTLSTVTFSFQNVFNTPSTSVFISKHLVASFYLCLMNLSPTTAQSSTRILLSNATACQVLGNIATMQFYYGGIGYAYNLYDTNIWDPQTQIWQISNARTSIPFLEYPSTYYTEINSATYNWIPSTFYQNDIVQLKLAKYSTTGQYLGLFDAVDTYIQLCGGGYTDGQAAFTFGLQYQRSCNIRADALWNSSLYETAFFDPYIAFTQSGSQYLLPTPIVITNYQTISPKSYPNQNADESTWTYNRRFFLLDRVSGITGNNVLTNVHYAQSIKILNTLTNGGANIQPPVIVIQYAELSTSDIGIGTIIQISFESDYRMNLDDHIRNIWIAVGVLSGLGLVLAFARTTVWQARAGKQIVDLVTIGKFIVYVFNVLATVFFIVMAGVSLWWLIFFKRQDAIYLVIPTSAQQVSFTALVCVAFALKTVDIIHLIFRQGNMDIFFIDWEKPKAGHLNTVSVWRTYFVANEFNEIQTFRRINLTFQLFFVLFLLKVINLENVATAQPGVNLFPSSSDYTPGYNGILRVGIAFSMWLATALVQYLIYILFYRRFVEDRIINFIDLCSVSNISVFILIDNLYGYYIHGRSPHGTTDVNMRDMLLNLEREGKQMSGTRGLEAKSDEQTFIMRIDPSFRLQYEILLRSYENRVLMHTTKNDEKESDILMGSYRNLNEFLCAFINHSLPTYNYTIRDRFLIEKILNYEVQLSNISGPAGQTDSVFFYDKEKSFINALFAGHENSLFVWNMATFLFIDYFAFNYVLAAVITYILNLIANGMRLSLGRRNLSTKTLIPKEFLI